MTSVLEQFVLAALALNDEIKLAMEEVSFTPAPKKPEFVGNADADGEALVRESHYGPAYLEATIRVIPKPTSDQGREVLGELTDALQACERVEGGGTLLWTPNESVRTYTGYVLSAEHTDIPLDVTGDTAGWFIKSPVVKFKLTMRPFLYTPERTVLAATESGAEPLQVLYIGGIKGDVPAEARLVVKDTAAQDRRYGGFGRDVVLNEANPALLITAANLVTTGFSGTATTRVGAYSEEKVKRAAAVSQATAIAGTGRIANVGTYAIYARVYATSELSRFRISYRNGDGPLLALEWKTPPVINGFAEIYMGEVFLDEVKLGTQTSEIRVEQKAAEGVPSNDVNYLILWPTTKGSSKARGPASNEPTSLLAYDNFEQEAGNLEGKSLPFPAATTWAEVNKTGENGFKVNAGHYAERAKVSDSTKVNGAFALAGTAKYTTAFVAATFSSSTTFATEALRLGVLGRYGSVENWVGAFLTLGSPKGAHEGALNYVYLTVIKREAGTETVLGESLVSSAAAIAATQVTFTVTAGGVWVAECGAVRLTGQVASFAAGGALAEGRFGIYDAWTAANACARTADSFQLLGAENPGRVCYASKQIEFRSDGVQRQDSTGVYDGSPTQARGGNFFLEPAGSSGAINRVAVRMRRNDVEAETDSAVTDKQSVAIMVTERWLLPR